MPNMETGIQHGCVILPFAREDMNQSTATTTTLAALLAVTVMHDESVSAEQRLIEIIEQSGEVEVLDTEDALADLGLEAEDIHPAEPTVSATNDNERMAIV